MRNLVEKLVPAEILLLRGIYVETWAHIELRLWMIVRSFRTGEARPTTVTPDELEIKTKTRELVEEFRRCKANVSPTLCVLIENAAARVSRSLTNRNLAAHGACFFDEREQTLKVSHYFFTGKRPNKQWFEADETLRISQIRSEIEAANQLLLDLNYLSEQIERELNLPDASS